MTEKEEQMIESFITSPSDWDNKSLEDKVDYLFDLIRLLIPPELEDECYRREAERVKKAIEYVNEMKKKSPDIWKRKKVNLMESL